MGGDGARVSWGPAKSTWQFSRAGDLAFGKIKNGMILELSKFGIGCLSGPLLGVEDSRKSN